MKLVDKFSGRVDGLHDKLEKQVELFQEVYQFYTFIQSQVIDDFIELNDR